MREDQEIDDAYQQHWDGENPPDPFDTVSYMQDALARFHNTKKVFLKYRSTKTIRRNATALAEAQAEDEALSPEVLSSMTKTQITEHNKHQAALKKKRIDEYVLEHSSFGTPKQHMMAHFGQIIPMYGTLKQYATEIVELNHQPLNVAYDMTNKVDATEQTIRHVTHFDAMNIRVANLKYLVNQDFCPPKLAEDIRYWIGISEDTKMVKARSRANRARMRLTTRVSTAAAKRKARKEALEAFMIGVRAT
ncbi:hypothetical protein BJ508DRAFT_316346, partial [Ascobolus immersus RN42]